MLLTILFLLLTLLCAAALTGVLFHAARAAARRIGRKPDDGRGRGVKRAGILCAAALALNAGLVLFSQYTASTPPIRGEKASVAELKRVELNGTKQWISIRGVDQSKPVLLFLAGGPGGSQLAAVRHELPELEKHFIVVGWDQPGAAKSYSAQAVKDITPETYIRDGYALTNYLKKRFRQEKIYLVGESWGSALGIFLIDRHPEQYHAFIGAAQMVAFAETERICYEKALALAKEKGDGDVLKKLEKNGPAPYHGKGVTWKSASYLNYLSAHMANNPDIHNPGYQTLRDIFSSEYGILDKINYARGVVNTYGRVYQQLYGIDLRKDYPRLEVPVYFFLGRHDVNAPTELAEEYFTALEAPEKKLVWFEHSGHSPWINERGRFTEELLACFS